MNLLLDQALRHYGAQVNVTRGTRSWKTSGFFQSKGENLYSRVQTELGEDLSGKYAFIGQLTPSLAAGDILTVEGVAYLIQKVETVFDGKGPAYQLCGCVRKGQVSG